jgi:phosphopantetheine adenylyltransferase
MVEFGMALLHKSSTSVTLVSSTLFRDLAASADTVAKLVIAQVRPGPIMLEDESHRWLQ